MHRIGTACLLVPEDLHGAMLFNDSNHSELLLPTDLHAFMLSNDGTFSADLAPVGPNPNVVCMNWLQPLLSHQLVQYPKVEPIGPKL